MLRPERRDLLGSTSTTMSAASAVPAGREVELPPADVPQDAAAGPSCSRARATPSPTAGGSATSSTAAAADGLSSPAAVPTPGRLEATSACFKPAASRSGRASASSAAAPAVRAAAALEPLSVP